MTGSIKAKGYFRDEGKDGLVVGASCIEEAYFGPQARITYNADWLHIVTDDYEGHAMLNIEALPSFRLALSRIARELRERSKP